MSPAVKEYKAISWSFIWTCCHILSYAKTNKHL